MSMRKNPEATKAEKKTPTIEEELKQRIDAQLTESNKAIEDAHATLHDFQSVQDDLETIESVGGANPVFITTAKDRIKDVERDTLTAAITKVEVAQAALETASEKTEELLSALAKETAALNSAKRELVFQIQRTRKAVDKAEESVTSTPAPVPKTPEAPPLTMEQITIAQGVAADFAAWNAGGRPALKNSSGKEMALYVPVYYDRDDDEPSYERVSKITAKNKHRVVIGHKEKGTFVSDESDPRGPRVKALLIHSLTGASSIMDFT